jgi:VWFA-related protein
VKKQSLVALFLLLSTLTQLMGQTAPPASGQQQQQGEDEVVRITTNLVQVDAVVTGDDGKQVTDLRPEDFEITEDGRPQVITNFSYISSDPTAQPVVTAATTPPSKNAPPVRPARLRPTDAHRTIVLVVDDLGMSFESVNLTKQAMKKFLEEQMQPNDLVAIVRTSGGVGALQQLTSDKRQLSAAIERVRWQSFGRTGVSAVASLSGQSVGPGAPVVDTLKSLNFIITGLKGLPGRKSLLFFSDSFVIFPDLKGNELEEFDKAFKGGGAGVKAGDGRPDSEGVSMAKALENIHNKIDQNNIALSDSRQSVGRPSDYVARMVDLANQASVVIYTIDPRGLPIFSSGADSWGKDALASDTAAPGNQETYMRRSLRFQQTQVGLSYVARQTGGFLVSNTNDITGAVRRVVNDLRGYYLIGYRPSESTFKEGGGDRSRFHKIAVNVKKPGLSVRSRKGFFGLTEDERRSVPRTRSEQLLSAISSPFQTGGVNLRLTSLFGNDLKTGSFVRTLLHVDANALTFKPDAEGWQTAVMEVLAMTFDESGNVIEQVTREEKISAKGATHQRLLRNGLVYSFDVPVKKAGSYQLRVAVRDAATERVGSAQQLVEVPDLSKSSLTLSGIFARGVDPAATAAASTTNDSMAAGLLSGPPKISDAEATTADVNVQPGPEVRRLRRGLALEYTYTIFNAVRDRSTNRPQLQTRAILFRDGQQVWAGETKFLETNGQAETGALTAGGRLMLGAEMTPGEYILQVVVTDALVASAEKRTATQWVDFEIVK